MKNIRRGLYYFFGKVYIPEEIMNCKEEKLLHISDTPSSFYSGLNQLIQKLNPKYIVHTGDMVDNIKLELYPSKRKLYRDKVKILIDMLEDSSADRIYIVMGNHDDYEIVSDYAKRSTIIKESSIIDIDNIQYKVSHFSKDVANTSAKYNLFGHDLAMISRIEKDKVYLNGITGINIIALKSGKIFVLPYPYGTNDDRMCKSNIGL
ncbi:metallophosphoesterase [Wukongibacter baidiensis]|uniref:metallophosphoesterase n=1 Tax=Wukongibacter baidiensis TaxID=1723361 RepID=UPI003D7FB736